MGKLQFSELVEAALLEQHRWEVGCEALYRRGLRSDPVDVVILHDMLKTFGVARNLSPKGKSVLAEKVPSIALSLLKSNGNWGSIFEATGPNGAIHIEGSPGKSGRRSFISGLTKVLWFAGAHRLPMFDSLTCRKVAPNGTTQVEKAINFYRILKDPSALWGYDEAVKRIEEAHTKSPQNWQLFPERLIDKLLLISAMSEKNIREKLIMGTDTGRRIYRETLQAKVCHEMDNLTRELVSGLAGSQLAAKLAA